MGAVNIKQMRKGRRVLRWIGRTILRLLLWCSAVGVVVYSCGGWFLPGVVERELSRQFDGAAVSIQGARFSGAGILIKGVAIAEQESSLAFSPIFFAERVRVSISAAELLKRRLVIQSAVIRDAVVTAEFEKGRGWNIQRLRLRSREGHTQRPLPLIRIERGAIRLRRVEGGEVSPITAVGFDGQIAAVGSSGTYGFTVRADERLALTGSWIEGLLQTAEPGGKNRLTMTGAVRMPRTWILDNAWDLDNVGLDCAFDSETIDIVQLRFAMDGGQGEVRGRLGLGKDKGFDVKADLVGFVLSNEPARNRVVYGPSVLKMLGAKAEQFMQRFRPRGAGDIHLQVQGQWSDLAATEMTGHILCQDVTVEDARFPYPLEQMQGEIAFTKRSLSLKQLSCSHGSSAFMVDGGVENIGPEQAVNLHVVSDCVEFDEDVYRALGQEAKRLWFAFMPSGRGAIDYFYQRLPDGQRTRRLAVELIDAGAMYEHFPYPLEHLTGRLTLDPNGVTLENITAHYPDSRRITLNGNVSASEDRWPEFSIRVQAEQIPVDAALIDAMPKAQQTFFEQLDLEATATMDVEVFPDATGQRPLDYTAHFLVEGPRLVYAGFAVPLENVRIAADLTQDAVLLREFSGHRGGGQVSMRGWIVGAGQEAGRPGLCLDMEAKEFDLDETFWSAAESEIRQLPPALRIGGPVTVHGHWSRNMPSDQCMQMKLTVECRDNPILIEGTESGRASGTVRFEEGRVELDNFKIVDMVLNPSLAKVMPVKAEHAYQGVGVSGWVDMVIPSAHLRLDEEGFAGMDINGRLTLRNVKTENSNKVENLNGFMEGRLSLDADEQVQAAEGIWQAEGFRVQGRLIDRLAGRFVFDPNEGVLASRDISAALCGGSAAGSATVKIVNGETFLNYTFGLAFEGIEVGQVVDPGPLPVDNEQVQRGQANGVIDLQGCIGQPQTKQGRIDLTVSKMQLGKQTLIGKMLTVIQFREPKDYVFNRMEMEVFVMGDELVCERVRIVGRPFVFHGKGRVDLGTNRITMDLVALGGLAGVEPVILDSLLRGLGSAFWKIEIRGDLREPEIRTISLPIIQFPLDLLKR